MLYKYNMRNYRLAKFGPTPGGVGVAIEITYLRLIQESQSQRWRRQSGPEEVLWVQMGAKKKVLYKLATAIGRRRENGPRN
jgi:hypothetical protein